MAKKEALKKAKTIKKKALKLKKVVKEALGLRKVVLKKHEPETQGVQSSALPLDVRCCRCGHQAAIATSAQKCVNTCVCRKCDRLDSRLFVLIVGGRRGRERGILVLVYCSTITSARVLVLVL